MQECKLNVSWKFRGQGNSLPLETARTQVAQMVKNMPAMQETQVQSLDQEDPLEKWMTTHSSILGEFHGQRSLVGYSPWSHKELDITEQLTH